MKKRKCSVCHSTEHRADFHGSKRDRELPPVDMLPPDVAMRTMIQPFYALWLVCENNIGEALANCARTFTGPNSGDTLLIALAELDRRARTLDPEQVVLLRKLRRKRDEAEVAYMAAAAAITEKLGYPEGAK